MEVIRTNRNIGVSIGNIMVVVKNGEIISIREFHNDYSSTTFCDQPTEEICIEYFRKIIYTNPSALVKVLTKISDEKLKEEGKILLLSYLLEMKEAVEGI